VELGGRKHNTNNQGQERGVAAESLTILVLNKHRDTERYYHNVNPHLAEIYQCAFVNCQATRPPSSLMRELAFLCVHLNFVRNDGA
jgi:hypothetical protein